MILLTSPSSRRRQLLEQIGFIPRRDYVQIDMPINPNFHADRETLLIDETIDEIIKISRLKVQRAVEDRRVIETEHLDEKTTVVVGVTTAAFYNGKVLGRPLSTSGKAGRILDKQTRRLAEDEARIMLQKLSGKEFQVVTSIVMAKSEGNKLTHVNDCYVVTQAWMKPYGNDEIERYIKTGEPLDKAGGFGIQEKGAVLFDRIKGSYSNVVGLPLPEFYEMLHRPEYRGCVSFHLDEKNIQENEPNQQGRTDLKVVSMGDINYDLSCADFEAGFFRQTTSPGAHVNSAIHRNIGGTGVNFARHAAKVGFRPCSLLGVIAGDALGRDIERELAQVHHIQTLLPMDYNRKTSIAILLRDKDKEDTLISLVDSNQSLTEDDVEKAMPAIRSADVFFVSGYCLTDPNRQKAAIKAVTRASDEGALVILDAPVNMEENVSFEDLKTWVGGRIDVLVIEIQTLFKLLGRQPLPAEDDWAEIQRIYHEHIQPDFPVLFLRDSKYTKEFMISPHTTYGPIPLNFASLSSEEKIGYGDGITAHRLAQFLSPRVLLASESPRRLALLEQIVAANKIRVSKSGNLEQQIIGESPEIRVKRLALEKAQQAWINFKNHADENDVRNIQLVIGADTEIVLNNIEVGHPRTDGEAREILRMLSNHEHTAITGLALIQRSTGKEVQFSAKTQVKFKKLTDEIINQYVASGEPIGKAGAYGIQGKGALFVESIEGSYSNVVGLPLEILSDELKKLSIPIWDIDRVSNWNLIREAIE